MRINNIDANTAFKRVIRLNPPAQRVEFSADDRDFGVLHELENVLNSRDTKVYTKNQASKIREFFKNILGDYNGENGIMIQKAYGDTLIISGKDAQKVKELEKEHGVAYNNLSSLKPKRGANSRRMKNRKMKDESATNARVIIGKELKKRNENGEKGKPETEISFEFKTGGRPGANRIDTSKFGKIEYSSLYSIEKARKLRDGNKTGAYTVFRSICYDIDELKI